MANAVPRHGEASAPAGIDDDAACRRVLCAADHYEALGLPRGSPEAAVRAEFRRRALEVHPDKNSSSQAERAFQRLQAAHRVLADPEARKVYDEQLNGGSSSSSTRWLFGWGAGAATAARRPRRVLVLRHGSRAEGGVDPLLDVLGRWQAEQVTAYLAEEVNNASASEWAPFGGVFCSPFRRALQTAAPLAAALGLPLRVEWGFCDLLAHGWLYNADPLPMLRGRKRGSLPGRAQMDKSYESSVVPEYPDVEGRIEPGNEAQRRRALERHRAAVEAALASASGGSVIIVGHGPTHDFVAQALCPAQHSVKHHSGAFSVPYCGVTEIVEGPGGWRLAALGHTRWSEEDISARAWKSARQAAETTLDKGRRPKKSMRLRRPAVAAVTVAAAAAAVMVAFWLRPRRHSLR